ncbi:7220_t:CDS:1, partial [Funneliformis geosporum]
YNSEKKLQERIRNIKTGQLEKVLNVSESDFIFSENESFSSESNDNFVDNLLMLLI